MELTVNTVNRIGDTRMEIIKIRKQHHGADRSLVIPLAMRGIFENAEYATAEIIEGCMVYKPIKTNK